MNCNTEKQVVFCCLCCRKIQRLCKARAEAKFTWIMPSRRQRCIYMNVCARREQKPSLLGLCRAAANFRASECRAELVRAMPSAAENVKKTSVENELGRAFCRTPLLPSAAENVEENKYTSKRVYE